MIAPAALRLDRHVLGQLERADDRIVVEVPGVVQLTGADIRGLVGGLIGDLRSLGVSRGDRLAVVAPNRPEVLAWWLAASVVAGITVPIADGATGPELRRAIELVRPAVVLVDASTEAKVTDLGLAATVHCDHVRTDAAAGVPAESLPMGAELEACAIRFSSGTTTGEPRALEVSHRSLVLTLMAEALEAGAMPTSELVVALPLQGAGAWFSLAFLSVTAKLTLLGRPSELAVDHLRAASHLVTVPEMLHRLASDLPSDLGPLRVLTTGAPLPGPVRDAWQVAGAELIDFYGSTETEVATTCRPGESSTGHAFYGTELRAGTVSAPAPFEKRGPDVYSGLWSPDAESPSPDLVPTWVPTGDLATVDANGEVAVVGRADDVMVVRGNNVHPLEIEDVLAQDDDIREVAVALVHDNDRSTLVAFVVADEHAEARWRDLCAEHLAPYKRPARYLSVGKLPRNAFGKLERRKLPALLD